MAIKRIQASGRKTFKEILAKDVAFWSKCEHRWGGGPGYRTAIRDMTDEEFEKNLEYVHRIIAGLLANEWERLMSLMMHMLREHPHAATP